MEIINKKNIDRSEQAFLQLKREIISGQRGPGSVFDEKKFAEQMNISRTPVHEAVMHLAREGLLNVVPRRGTFISHISMDDVRQLYEVRLMMEPSIARIAAKRADQTIMKQWENYFLSQKEAEIIQEEEVLPGGKSLGVFPDADAVFHLFLSESTQNRFLVKQTEELMTQTQRIRCLSNLRSKENLLRSIHEHLEIVRAILAGDGEQAFQASWNHLKNSSESYDNLISNRTDIKIQMF